MIVLDFDQGTPEWEAARLGIPTASQFGRIVQPKKLGYSSAATKYRNELLAEWLLGHPESFPLKTGWTEHGSTLESEARQWYELETAQDGVVPGFVLRDDRQVGGSPDWFRADRKRGAEFKCPSTSVHIGYLLNPDGLLDDYFPQVQGYIYLTGAEGWDLASYHTELPPVRLEIEPDEAFLKALGEHLATFIDDLNARKEQLGEYRIGSWSAPEGTQLAEALQRSLGAA